MRELPTISINTIMRKWPCYSKRQVSDFLEGKERVNALDIIDSAGKARIRPIQMDGTPGKEFDKTVSPRDKLWAISNCPSLLPKEVRENVYQWFERRLNAMLLTWWSSSARWYLSFNNYEDALYFLNQCRQYFGKGRVTASTLLRAIRKYCMEYVNG